MRISSFFKVYTKSTSSKSLQLPPKFVEELEGFVPKKPTLKNGQGRCWTVHTEKKGRNFFFMNGWSKFVSDISLEDGHVLVFDYDGELCFDFMHFGVSKCEQKCVQPQSTMNDLENVEEGQDGDEDDDDEDYEDDEDDEDDDNDYYEDDNKKLKKTSLSITQKEKQEKGKAIVDSNVGLIVKGKKPSSFERPEVESEEDIFKYGVVKRPNNPHFVTRLGRDKHNEMHFPARIMKDYNIKLPSTIMLVDQEGRQIYSTVVMRKGGRTLLTAGWKLFVRYNDLVEEDMYL